MAAKKNSQDPDLEQRLIAFIERFKAGSPTEPSVFWVSKKPKELAKLFNEEYAGGVSHGSFKRLLKELGYAYRKQSKQLATGTYAPRNEQFAIITQLILIMSTQSPIISIDCKKKERLGNLYREGRCYCQAPIKVYDRSGAPS